MPSLREEITSSNIKAVEYDEDSNNLILEFMNGSRYEYSEVPKSVYETLLQADSKGRFVNSNIKGSYKFKKL